MSDHHHGAEPRRVSLAPIEGPLRLLVIVGAAALFLAVAISLANLASAPDRAAVEDHVPVCALSLHLLCVVPAIPLGAIVLLRRKGDALHKLLGRVWGCLMAGAALSSFALTGLMGGAFSPIHLLSVLTLVTLPWAVVRIRQGRVAAHRRAVVILYVSLLAAGAFAFLPGRALHHWLLG